MWVWGVFSTHGWAVICELNYFLVFVEACKFELYSGLPLQFVMLCSDVFVSSPVIFGWLSCNLTGIADYIGSVLLRCCLSKVIFDCCWMKSGFINSRVFFKNVEFKRVVPVQRVQSHAICWSHVNWFTKCSSSAFTCGLFLLLLLI